ncbi:MAG: hypothetical protein H5U08_11555 [Thermogutta sp.]|nr:hypothetical protein [Thermogutta sp.]
MAAAQGLPESVKGEIVIGHGAEVTGKPEDHTVVDIPADQISCPPNSQTTCVVLVEHEGTVYIVTLAHPVECTPTKAANL